MFVFIWDPKLEFPPKKVQTNASGPLRPLAALRRRVLLRRGRAGPLGEVPPGPPLRGPGQVGDRAPAQALRPRLGLRRAEVGGSASSRGWPGRCTNFGAFLPGDVRTLFFLPTIGFSIKPRKVKLPATESNRHPQGFWGLGVVLLPEGNQWGHKKKGRNLVYEDEFVFVFVSAVWCVVVACFC